MRTENVTVGPRSVSSKTPRKRPSGALKSRRKFLYYFPGGFYDETYIDWERNYKWKAHQQWEELLNRNELRHLLKQKQYGEIAGSNRKRDLVQHPARPEAVPEPLDGECGNFGHRRDTTPHGDWPTGIDLITFSAARSITEMSLLTPFVV